MFSMTIWNASIGYILIREIFALFDIQTLASWIHTIAVISLFMTSKIKFLQLGSIFLGVLP